MNYRTQKLGNLGLFDSPQHFLQGLRHEVVSYQHFLLRFRLDAVSYPILKFFYLKQNEKGSENNPS